MLMKSIPVSYTHLDVYKRQPIFFPGQSPHIFFTFILYTLFSITYLSPKISIYFHILKKTERYICYFYSHREKFRTLFLTEINYCYLIYKIDKEQT